MILPLLQDFQDRVQGGSVLTVVGKMVFRSGTEKCESFVAWCSRKMIDDISRKDRPIHPSQTPER